MEQLKIGYLRTEQQEQFLEWVNATPGNLFDRDILKAPTLSVLCSYNGSPVAYLPMQQALVLESLAVNQAATLMDKGQAFRDLVKGAEQHASSHKIRELYMPCEDERVIRVAENHGFERLKWPVLRMKL